MFVLKSKYNEIKKELKDVKDDYFRLARRYNEKKYAIDELKQLIVSKRGFLGDDDIKKLLMLCHPDKHNNNQLSVDVTRWLLSMRN